jgi:hypothetical protein
MLNKSPKKKSPILLFISVLIAGLSITLICFSHSVFHIGAGIVQLIASITLFIFGLDINKIVKK